MTTSTLIPFADATPRERLTRWSPTTLADAAWKAAILCGDFQAAEELEADMRPTTRLCRSLFRLPGVLDGKPTPEAVTEHGRITATVFAVWRGEITEADAGARHTPA